MKLILTGVAAALMTIAAPASATVINFDDIDASKGVVGLPNNYGGISWDSGQFGVWMSSPMGSYPPSSGPNSVLVNRFSSGIDPISFSFAKSVTFNGLYFAYASQAGAVSYDLISSGAVKSTVQVDKGNAFYASTYEGPVDQVRINGKRGFYVFDDVTFNNVNSAVPEPATWALMILGFGAIGYALRRRPAVNYKLAR